MMLIGNNTRMEHDSLQDLRWPSRLANERRASDRRAPAHPENLPLRGSVAWVLEAVERLGNPNRCRTLERLPELVLQSVMAVNAGALVKAASPGSGIAFESEALLALVTYCYASGICGSQDIEDLMCEDRDYRMLCSNEFPRRPMIRYFRRCNRRIIENCLGEVLRRLATNASDRETHPRIPASGPELAWEEASRRVEIAIIIDMAS